MRFLVLALGPLFLIAAAYAACFPAGGTPTEHAEVSPPATRAEPLEASSGDDLARACRTQAERIAAQIGRHYEVLVRPPFVLISDVPADRLQQIHADVVAPIWQALWRCFFDRRPDQPITLVLLSRDDIYRDVAQILDGHAASGYAGYYQRESRRIVLSLATGDGTIAHELTHALSHADFPEMPEWFDEGLAALFEESEFSADGSELHGLDNWRRNLLVAALRLRKLPHLRDVLISGTFREEGEGLKYAHVRYFCLYLQDRGLLAHFYRKFRTGHALDPTGASILGELTGTADLDELDRAFRTWLREDHTAGTR